ncbi:MAG: ATP-binding protein [Candidatus Woesebacteria bacterium]
MEFKPITYLHKRLKAYTRRKKTQVQTRQFEFATQDQLDLISYPSLQESANHIEIDGKVMRTLFISGYPYVATTGWLSMLTNFNHNVDISYHIELVDPLIALPKLTRKITELESTRRAMLAQGKIISSEILDPLESATNLKDRILRGQEKLFQVSIYITLIADTLQELNKITTLLETTLATKLFYTKVAGFQQLEALQSILPRAENLLAQKRNLDSSSAALTFPFTSSELVQESGILYGINKSNNSLVIIDRFSLHNANSIIFAQSGSGKSYAAKVEILRQLMQKTSVIVIDPEREYKQLCESLHGTYIKLSVNSKEKINPFDFSLNTSATVNTLAEHIQDLTEVISLMVEGLTAQEKAILDRAIIQTYKDAGYTLRGKPQRHTKDYPLLKQLYKNLKAAKQESLTARLEKFVSGSLATVFDSQTNIKLDNRLVIFDIKDLPESIRQIMLVIVANFVQTQVKNSPQKRLLVIDEGWLLLQHQESARFIAGLARRARKYYLGVSIITQQANDFLSNEYGRAIASQASLRILMRQDTTTISGVAQEFKLSEYEEKFLLSCDRGEAIIIADQNHVAIKVVASEKEHPLITTDPRELFQTP